ncbi:MAG: antitoxin Xre/MbcA/ParS toxin-binding domain-containing protein [Thiohalorhabdaceae bacterium]
MAESSQPTLPPEDERAQLAYMVLALFRRWGLEDSQKLELLGHSPREKKRLEAHKKGRPLEPDPETLGRASGLLAIHQQLADRFPGDDDIRTYTWVVTPQSELDDRRPLDIMLEDGVPGIRRVLEHLQGGQAD